MFQAIRFDRLGGPEVLRFEDIADRQPGAGEVSLKVEAVGLNRAESMYYRGFYMETPELPSGLGYEAVGTVAAVGAGVDASLVGHRFGTIPGYSMNRYPVLAEAAVVPASVLAPVPESFSAAEGAAVWMPYCTAYGALVPFGKVSTDDFVIVTAASSSVGLAAIQIVKAQGGISIATTRTAAKKDRLLGLGADHVIVTDEEDLVARVAEITGSKRARIVFDPIGGDGINALAQATANGGTIYLYGMLSGHPTPFPLSAFGRRIAMYGYTFSELRDTPEWDVMKRYIHDHLVDGSFKPEIARTFPFAETVEAYRYLESNEQVGKVVITL
ncbi:MAG: zinc-dependent alcohol dehydrogenase family protein [Azospirillaceae bacterium]|nr:zinc-dependent alcohol dehydrogenase family protein [Azospirillaceae bacterium]